jgi:uracil-DNA glycosylase family 4
LKSLSVDKSLPDLTDLLLRVQRCRICPTIAPYRKFPAANRGTAKHRLMIVGEAPGRVSLEHGRAFSNPSNLTIRRGFALAMAPWALELDDAFYMTDVVKCWPAKGLTANRSPVAAEVRMCAARFLGREIDIIKPHLVMTFGALAARAVIGQKLNLTEVHGKALDSGRGFKMVPLVHPSTINITGMRRAGIGSLAEYEQLLARLFRTHIPREVFAALAAGARAAAP